MKYKLIVLDLDGTLTNSKKEITLRNKEVLIRVQEQGVRVVLASGRPTYGIVPLAKDTQIWALSDCFPFTENRQHPKVTSSRAFVYSLSCYKILVDKIDTVLKKPLQTSNDDW